MADKGKGAYVAFVAQDNDGHEYVTTVQDHNFKSVHDFDQAVKLAERQVINGNVSRSGVIEVVELTVARRAIVKRTVEVTVQ